MIGVLESPCVPYSGTLVFWDYQLGVFEHCSILEHRRNPDKRFRPVLQNTGLDIGVSGTPIR